MTNKNQAIVFGGAGFLGSQVSLKLVELNYDVTVFDIARPSDKILDPRKYNLIQGDILNLESIRQAVAGKSIIYNFAGAADLEGSIQNPLKYLNLNIIGNANILQAASEEKAVHRFVYASSAYALSDKGAFYGASKLASEKIIEIYQKTLGINYTILRYGSVYGPWASNSNRIYKFIKEAIDSGAITFSGDGSEIREYIHVDDAAELSVKILEESGKNKSFILTGSERLTYKELLAFIREIIDPNLEIKILGKDYSGHYSYTPYKYSPELGKKLINNPSIDFGQGIIDCITHYTSAKDGL